MFDDTVRAWNEYLRNHTHDLLDTMRHNTNKDTGGHRKHTEPKRLSGPGPGCMFCAKGIYWCPRCHKVRYCSRECQVAWWPSHRRQCKKDRVR